VDILFTFVMQGSMELSAEGHEKQALQAGDAVVLPPNMTYQFTHLADDLELLEVALPGVSQE
jgi:quercetin dioxygenase-like cupin family protein